MISSIQMEEKSQICVPGYGGLILGALSIEITSKGFDLEAELAGKIVEMASNKEIAVEWSRGRVVKANFAQ